MNFNLRYNFFENNIPIVSLVVYFDEIDRFCINHCNRYWDLNSLSTKSDSKYLILIIKYYNNNEDYFWIGNSILALYLNSYCSRSSF